MPRLRLCRNKWGRGDLFSFFVRFSLFLGQKWCKMKVFCVFLVYIVSDNISKNLDK